MKRSLKLFATIAAMFLMVGCAGSSDPTPSEPTLLDIRVSKQPTKLVYTVNETFTSAGLEVTARYSDSTNKVVTPDPISAPDMSTAGSKDVTVTYKTKSTKFTITVNPASKVLSSISLDALPTKTTYVVGEEFDSTGLIVRAHYSDSSSAVVAPTMISAMDMSSAGTKIATVYYSEGGVTTSSTFTIQVNNPAAKTLSSISLDSMPTKLTYTVGETFNSAGLIVRAHYSDSSSAVVTPTSISSPDMSSAGTKAVTVSYTEGGNTRTTSFNITVNNPAAKTLSSISIDSMPTKTTYNVGETFSSAGLVVRAHYSDSSSAVVTPTSISSPDMSSAGSKTVTVSYIEGGVTKTTTFSITVNNPQPTGNVDTLVLDDTGMSGSTYGDWDSVTKTTSAVYAGNSAGGYNAIQLRSSNNTSGIITTTSGGNISKVSVVWNSNTYNGRKLDVYAKNTAYTSASDLYDSSTQGTKIGSIDFGSTTELSISDSYSYVGVRSNNSALYLDSISFTWGDPVPVTLSSISIESEPSKVLYEVGETFSSAGLVIRAHYSDSSSKIVSPTSISSPDMSTAGTKVVTVSYTEGGLTESATFNITVSSEPIPVVNVTGVSVSPTSLSMTVGDAAQSLTATVSPSNATDKSVTWSSSKTSVATVSNGVVSAVGAGTAVITVTTNDGGFTATCNVTVEAAKEYPLITDASSLRAGDKVIIASYSNKVTASNTLNSKGYLEAVTSATFNSDGSKLKTFGSGTAIFTVGGSAGKWTFANESGYLLGTSAAKKVGWDDGVTTWTVSIVSGDAEIESTYADYGRILYNKTSPRFTTYTSATSASMLLVQLYRYAEAVPVDPTGVTVSPTTAEVAQGRTKTLTVGYLPENANRNLGVTWSTSAPGVVDVNDGVVSVSDSAPIGTKATITATSVFNTDFTASCEVTVTEFKADKYTIMLYVCGSNLESDGGCARDDLQEILQVRAQQPDDINIIVETGGCTSWYMPGVSTGELGRFEIDSACSATQMRKITAVEEASMGDPATLTDFMNWGFENYPAEKYGLLLWNHGGSMDGCCFDDLYDSDSLTSGEVDQAVSSARSTSGITDKLDFIAYDACLMAVQDIAEMNSHNFKYQLSSQESEWSGGYDYDKCMPTLYADPDDTAAFLTKVGETFMDEQEKEQKHYDQTQSVLDLSYMDEYLTAWEDMSDTLNSICSTDSSKWTTFANAVNTARKYGQSTEEGAEEYNDGYLYDIFDVKGALTAVKSSFSSNKTFTDKIDVVLGLLSQIIIYNRCGSQVSGSNGLCMFCPISGYSLYEPYVSSEGTYPANYAASDTNFTHWRNVCISYGTWWE